MSHLANLLDFVNKLESFKSEVSTCVHQDIEALQRRILDCAANVVGTDTKLTRNEINLLDSGRNKIAAIKAYRQRTNTGLVEAKNAVEEYMLNTYGGKYWNEQQGFHNWS